MELHVQNSSPINIDDMVFGRAFNEDLIHQVVVAFQLASRSGTRAQKTRAEVRGGGAKPWRQKGTGRARAGSSRGPIWRSGGVTFAAKPQNWKQKINKKMYRAAMSSIFSELIRSNRLLVVENIQALEPKTKVALNMLKDFGTKKGSVLLVTHSMDLNLELSTRNIPNVQAIEVASIDPVCLIHFNNIVITRDALCVVEEWLK